MVNDVMEGSRVVYTANGAEHDAIALGKPTLGVNSGTKSASHYLNLVYLSETGENVKVMGAPLVTAAATPEMLDQYAELNAAAEQRPGPARDEARERWRRRLEAEPRTTGWRPKEYREEVTRFKDAQANLQRYLDKTIRLLKEAETAANRPAVERFTELLKDAEVQAFVKDPANYEQIEAILGNQLEPETEPQDEPKGEPEEQAMKDAQAAPGDSAAGNKALPGYGGMSPADAAADE